jgi:hypothetical protein
VLVEACYNTNSNSSNNRGGVIGLGVRAYKERAIGGDRV